MKQKICAERPDPPSHCELADTLNDLGLVHLKQGKARLQDAEAAFKQALAIRTDPRLTAFQRQYNGPHPLPPDPDVAIAYNNLALCHLKQRRLFEAEAGFRAALELQRSQGEPSLADPLELGHLTHNLATVHQLQGQLQLARTAFSSLRCASTPTGHASPEGVKSGTEAEDARMARATRATWSRFVSLGISSARGDLAKTLIKELFFARTKLGKVCVDTRPK